MGPMVAAVSPLLPDGELLYFDFQGMKKAVTLTNGNVAGGGTSMQVNSFKLPEKTTTAIITDSLTASSGETLLLCFRGLPNTKTFGSATAGYASCNSTIQLYDGACMELTIGKDVARTGESFCEDPISPDVTTDNPIEEAILWIKSQN